MEERIPNNPGIRHFIWEQFQSLNHVIQRVKYCSGTFSSPKLVLCTEEIIAVGHCCMLLGRLPDLKYIDKIVKWGPCKDISETCAFLGTIGVCCMFILNFTKHASPLVNLTRKGVPFLFGPEQVTAQEDLKEALIASPTLRPIDYLSNSPVILAVNTSLIVVGFYLCQADSENLRKRYFTRFGSLLLNKWERHFLS